MGSDCKKCYWYDGNTCTNKYESKNFDYQYRHPNNTCREYDEK